MPSNTDILKLKELYESLDRLQESGEDVVAEIRKEINNIELQYLKEDVFPEMMKTLSRKISWLRCSVDMSLQFDGEKQLDYSFCKSDLPYLFVTNTNVVPKIMILLRRGRRRKRMLLIRQLSLRNLCPHLLQMLSFA